MSREREEEPRFKAARAGVAMTTSGESASRDLWTASDIFCARLIALMSFAAKDENASVAL